MLRTSLVIALAAAVGFATGAHAESGIIRNVGNGTSLDGISAGVRATLRPAGGVKFGYFGNNPGHFSGSGTDPTDRAATDARDAVSRAVEAEIALLTVEAFLQIPSNGISLNGVTLNGGQAQGHAVTEPGSASSDFAVQAIVLRSGETVDLR